MTTSKRSYSQKMMNGRTDKVSNKADVTINSFKIKIYLNFIALPTETETKILKNSSLSQITDEKIINSNSVKDGRTKIVIEQLNY